MAENYFLLPEEEYQRSISPVKDWLKQTAIYASKMLNKPYEECYAHLEKKLRSKEIQYKDPMVSHYLRESNGDRHVTKSTLSGYIREAIQNNDIIAPTFTTYLHPDVCRSSIVRLLDRNVAQRKKYKKTSQQYEAEGNKPKYKYFNQLQDAAKRKNNAVSGGFVAEGSVIQNKTGHSTLTSITRSIASLSNASNERLIEGNRHYYSPQIALNNIISIISETDFNHVKEAMSVFGLVYPSIEDTVECIWRSMKLYRNSKKSLSEIKDLIYRLSPEERAAVVYTGDLYHLRKHNEVFIREFITALSSQGSREAIENPVAAIYATDEQIVNYAHQVNISLMAGKGKKYEEKLGYEDQCQLANTCRSIENTVKHYRKFIQAFFLTKNSPCTAGTITSMQRRSVVLSDTDSTMFSTDSWVEWYFGKIVFTDEAYAVGGAVAFMATQAIAHILAIFSANLGAERSRLFTLAMKPEYVFPVFAQTSVAKHYYTAKKVKEGNVYADIDMEIKGVHMKDSTVPTNIISGAAKEMEAIIRSIMDGKLISLDDKLKTTSDLEREVVNSLYSGKSQYLRRFKIKESSSYKDIPSRSPYQFYTLWEKAFAKEYGKAPLPPYDAVRVPLDFQNKTEFNEWLINMENREIAEAIASWMNENGKTVIKNFPIPYTLCLAHGVPKELRSAMNTRKIVLMLTKSYRNIIESLGYFPKENFLITELIGQEIEA